MQLCQRIWTRHEILRFLIPRGRQRYSYNVMALYVIAFGLSSERNVKNNNDSNIPRAETNKSDYFTINPKAIT